MHRAFTHKHTREIHSTHTHTHTHLTHLQSGNARNGMLARALRRRRWLAPSSHPVRTSAPRAPAPLTPPHRLPLQRSRPAAPALVWPVARGLRRRSQARRAGASDGRTPCRSCAPQHQVRRTRCRCKAAFSIVLAPSECRQHGIVKSVVPMRPADAPVSAGGSGSAS